MTQNSPAPGWYPDPSDASRQLYWDGTAWRMPETVESPSGAVPNRLTLVQVFLSPKGRIGRQAYWIASLIILALYILLTVLINVTKSYENTVTYVLGLIVAAILIYGAICVLIKRCHDADKSGWLLLLGVIPIAGLVLAIWAGVSEGTRGPNRYGIRTNQTLFG